MKEKIKRISLNRRLLVSIIPILFLALSLFGWAIWNRVNQPPTPKVHFHAGFIVVKDDRLVDFSDSKYMDVEPCKLNPKDTEVESVEQQQISKAHLHDQIGDVVHVENSSALWKDLFTNLHQPINYQNVTAYINGNKIQSFQDQKIKAYQSLVLFIGNNNNTQKFLAQAVTKQHIQEVEKKSEDCGSHG